ncbi:MAG: hypothetical protein PHH26_04410 [Candidatus Thermoplasmatota archaeon]|nr:hypothetical protein [Candidatus Thermoplasmatota archaeon]
MAKQSNQCTCRPGAAYGLSLAGGILILIGGLVFGFVGSIAGAILALIPFVGGVLASFMFIWVIIGLVCGAMVIYGASMINTANPDKVRTGATLVLVFSLVAVLSSGGFGLGTALGVIGGILGLACKPC